MRKLLVVFFALLFTPTLTSAQQDNLAPIVALLDAQTFAVGRVQLAKIDAKAAVEYAVRFAPEPVPPEEAQTAAMQLSGFLATLREYGAQDLYLIASLADIPEHAPPLVLTLKAGANEDLIRSHLKGIFEKTWQTAERRGQLLIFGAEATLARLRDNQAVSRPDLNAALANTGNSPVQIAAAIPADMQRVVRELVGKLPPQIGGGEGEDLLAALQWTSLAVDLPPEPSVKWTIQSKTEEAAANLRPRILAALNLAGEQSQLKETMPDFAELAIRLIPATKGNRLERNLADQELEKVLKQLQAGPLKLLSVGAARSRSLNNLKQIALAMHNTHDVNGKFPAAAIASKDGKPLLSWRVHILPYIEQQALYQKFKLDEPWDSEHNRGLIEQMPPTYLDPANPQLAKEGKTVYAVAIGERTPFEGQRATKLQEIVDGTSNTILIVELPADKAVVWTKPDDWQFHPKEPAAGLFNGKRKEFLAAFGDGSVRAIPADINPADLRRLVQMNDGEATSKQY